MWQEYAGHDLTADINFKYYGLQIGVNKLSTDVSRKFVAHEILFNLIIVCYPTFFIHFSIKYFQKNGLLIFLTKKLRLYLDISWSQ